METKADTPIRRDCSRDGPAQRTDLRFHERQLAAQAFAFLFGILPRTRGLR